MQHPVGYEVNAAAGRAELKDFLAVVLNSTALITFPHTIAAAFMTAGAFIAGIAMYRLVRSKGAELPFRAAARAGAAMLLVVRTAGRRHR